MKAWISFAIFIVASMAYADGGIWLPNIPAYQTGTQVGGKNAADVNIAGGTVTFPSTLPVMISSPLPLPVTVSGPSPLPISGNVTIVGPSPLPVGGSVSIINTPTVIVSPTTLPVSIQSVAAGASPLPVAGNVTIAGPSPLPVGGTVSTKSPVNANGSTSVVTVTASEGSTAAPANSVCVLFENESGNSINMRWGVSNSASAILSSTVGTLLEPGRSSDGCVPVGSGSYLHYINVSAGSQPIDIVWVLSQ